MPKARLLTVLLVLGACGGSKTPAPSPVTPPSPAPAAGAPAPPPAAATRQLAADETVKTSSGAELPVAKGWYVTPGNGMLVLEDPDRELKVVLVEVAGPDRDAAVAAAWARFRPGFNLAVAQAVDVPARDGWEAVAQIAYVTKNEEKRTVVAVARRKGTVWYVALLDGKDAAFDRRGAQINTAVRGLKVTGMDQESFAGRTAHELDGERQKQLSAFIEEWRKKSEVPGVAVAVVQGGKIVYQQGFGVKQLGAKPQPVTPETLFMIGSNTKSLTTLFLARMVDRGLFGWDTPVTQLMPSFALGDPAVTKSLTMKHTVCACTGLPRQDLEFIFEFAKSTPEQRVASMKTMMPTTGFGETFQYSNTMVSTGGYVGAHALYPKLALGPAYDKAMQLEIFDPLGMKSTTFDFAVAARKNHAMPHGRKLSVEYYPTPLAWEAAVIAVRPAGAAWSNVRDLSRYLLLELANGKTTDGKQLVSSENLLKRREPMAKITDKATYGLGLMVVNDHELKVVQHGGNNLGYSSDLYFLPEQGIGVVVLTNAGGSNTFMAGVRRRLFEILFDGKPEAADNLTQGLVILKKNLDEETALIKPEPDRAWIDALLGEYDNPALGHLSLRRTGKQVILDVGEWKSPVSQKIERDGTAKVVMLAPVFAGFTLLPGEKDGKKTLTIEAAQQAYTFEPSAKK